MEYMERKIIDNIVKSRENQRLTKRDLATLLNMNEASYGRIENGKTALTISMLAKIANKLNMSIVDIITYPEKYTPVGTAPSEPVEAILQIRLAREKKDQVLKLVFGENNIEILNK